MFRALGARVALDAEGSGGPNPLEAAVGAVWRWAVSGIAKAPAQWTEGEMGSDAVSVQTVFARAEGAELYRTSVQRPDQWDPSVVWRTTADVVCHDDQVECGVAVEEELDHQHIAPSPLLPPLLELLHALVALGARAGGQRVSAGAHTVSGTEGVAAFVDRLLLDPGRVLPVMLFTSIKEEDGVYTPPGMDPSLVARELCALAHVCVVPRAEDTHKITRRLGMLSAYDGAIRVYWPQMRLDDPPPRHPLHLRTRLNTSSVPAIIRRIVEAGARAYQPPEPAEVLLAGRWRASEQERVEALLASASDDRERVKLLRSELERLQERVAQYADHAPPSSRTG